MPQLQPSRKRKRSSNDDEEDNDEDEDQTTQAAGRARGTILITLRNVPPYTEWYARCLSQCYRSVDCIQGTCQS